MVRCLDIGLTPVRTLLVRAQNILAKENSTCFSACDYAGPLGIIIAIGI